MIGDFSNFHFIRPLYLAVIPALVILWWVLGRSLKSTAWDKVINKEMLSVLRVQAGSGLTLWRWGLLLAWLLITVASAGPSWTKIPAPSYTNQYATVLILDLSRSMLAEDLSPNRLTRAKFKLIDILRQQRDGQIALVAYAGGAFAVSPLTDDPRTIEALLPALHPSIMPSQGSNTEAAIELASQLLRDAKVGAGNILLLTDGVSNEAQRTIKSQLSGSHSLSIIGIGTSEATPIPSRNGGFLKTGNGEIVLTQLNVNELRDLARAKNGAYANIQNDESDIELLLSEEFDAGARQQENEQNTDSLLDNRFDTWADMGHWLVLLILPFAAFAFRKGVLFILPAFLMVGLFIPEHSYAQESDTPTSSAFEWSHLWKTPNQRGAELYADSDYKNAAKTFEDKNWQASSYYKNGNYAAAEKIFNKGSDTQNLYNSGNSLALQGKLKEAIEVYDKVLEKDSTHEDAAANKALLEKLLEQQQDQQDQSQDQKNDDQQNEQDNKDSQQEGQNQQQNGESDQQQNDQQEQDSEESDQQDSQPQDSQPQDSENKQSEQDSDSTEQQENEQAQNDQQEQGQQKNEQQQQADQAEGEQQDAEQDNFEVLSDTPEDLGDANEQWLRAIPDDPSGFLRRKFEYQKQQRQQQNNRQSDEQQAERY